MNIRQSSSQTRCIKITVKDNEVILTTQLDDEKTIRVLNKCLNDLMDKMSRIDVPIGKDK